MKTPGIRKQGECIKNAKTTEEWKEIAGYKGLYEISSKGRVKSFPRNTQAREVFIRPQNTSHGYHQVGLSKEGVVKIWTVHRLVASAFLSPIKGKNCVNHKNGIKTDNRIENLEWCTKKENNKHAFRKGLINNTGSNHGCSKITEAQVLRIRLLKEVDKKIKTKTLGKMFGICRQQVGIIINRKQWKHI